MRGQIAHVPHTIVTPYTCGDSEAARSQNMYSGHRQPTSNFLKLRNSSAAVSKYFKLTTVN